MADEQKAVVPVPPQAAPVQASSAELLEKFLMQQQEQIAVRKDEVDLERQKDKHQYEFGLAALKAQTEDRKEQRIAAKSGRRDRLIFSGLVVVILASFVMYTLYLGKDEFAKETLKALVFLLAGGLSGYSLKAVRQAPYSGGASPTSKG